MTKKTDILPVVDKRNRVIGKAPRNVCHGNPGLAHCSVHIIIIDSKSRMLLQKRSKNKDIQPGKWDTSVGGHLDIGENFYQAAKREMREELGIVSLRLKRLYDYRWSNKIETESIRTYLGLNNGPFAFDRYEIDDVKFWSIPEIKRNLGQGIFTPNLKHELKLFLV